MNNHTFHIINNNNSNNLSESEGGFFSDEEGTLYQYPSFHNQTEANF